jgi:primosomal replication protein N
VAASEASAAIAGTLPRARPNPLQAPERARAGSALNRVVLSGRIVEREALRYTPAGLPLVRLRIEHRSRMMEAGAPRDVQCTVDAVAVGDVVLQLPESGDTASVSVRGFLCRGSLRDERLVLHLEALRREADDPNRPD